MERESGEMWEESLCSPSRAVMLVISSVLPSVPAGVGDRDPVLLGLLHSCLELVEDAGVSGCAVPVALPNSGTGRLEEHGTKSQGSRLAGEHPAMGPPSNQPEPNLLPSARPISSGQTSRHMDRTRALRRAKRSPLTGLTRVADTWMLWRCPRQSSSCRDREDMPGISSFLQKISGTQTSGCRHAGCAGRGRSKGNLYCQLLGNRLSCCQHPGVLSLILTLSRNKRLKDKPNRFVLVCFVCLFIPEHALPRYSPGEWGCWRGGGQCWRWGCSPCLGCLARAPRSSCPRSPRQPRPTGRFSLVRRSGCKVQQYEAQPLALDTCAQVRGIPSWELLRDARVAAWRGRAGGCLR